MSIYKSYFDALDREETPGVEEIEAYMDGAYAKFVADNPNTNLDLITVAISIKDFNTIENHFGYSKLTGYVTRNAPWGFKLVSEDLPCPSVTVHYKKEIK